MNGISVSGYKNTALIPEIGAVATAFCYADRPKPHSFMLSNDSSGSNQRNLFEDSNGGDEGGSKEEVRQERERLLEKLGDERELNSKQARVAYLLSRFPETRNSDVTLQIQYWKTFQSHLVGKKSVKLDNLYDLERYHGLKRARAHIQNTLGLFQPTSKSVKKKRKDKSKNYRKEYEPSSEVTVPGVHVYADESGKNLDNLIIGSVWVLRTVKLASLYSEISSWKKEKEIDYEFHGSDLREHRVDVYKDFLRRFVKREGLIGFKAITIPSEGVRDEHSTISDLYNWLLLDGLRHEVESGRIDLPRRINFAKDAEEEGYDSRLLKKIEEEVNRESNSSFDGQIYFKGSRVEDSSDDPLVQISDLFTFCIHRVLNVAPSKEETHFKDEFSKWFLGEIGFDLNERQKQDRVVRMSLRSPTFDHKDIDVVKTPDRILPENENGDDKGKGSSKS